MGKSRIAWGCGLSRHEFGCCLEQAAVPEAIMKRDAQLTGVAASWNPQSNDWITGKTHAGRQAQMDVTLGVKEFCHLVIQRKPSTPQQVNSDNYFGDYATPRGLDLKQREIITALPSYPQPLRQRLNTN